MPSGASRYSQRSPSTVAAWPAAASTRSPDDQRNPADTVYCFYELHQCRPLRLHDVALCNPSGLNPSQSPYPGLGEPGNSTGLRSAKITTGEITPASTSSRDFLSTADARPVQVFRARPHVLPTRKIRVGIIGCGKISDAYFTGCRRYPVLDLIACADLDLPRAQAKAAEQNVRASTVDALLAAPTSTSWSTSPSPPPTPR